MTNIWFLAFFERIFAVWGGNTGAGKKVVDLLVVDLIIAHLNIKGDLTRKDGKINTQDKITQV